VTSAALVSEPAQAVSGERQAIPRSTAETESKAEVVAAEGATEAGLESSSSGAAAETLPVVKESVTPATSEASAGTEAAAGETAAANLARLEAEGLEPLEDELELPEGPLVLPDKGSPKYAFDYRGRLWVEKKHKSFFRQLRRPQIPPEEPGQ
jgi:hypothetical protein